MKFIVYPYKIASGSAKSLAESLGSKRVRQNGKYKYFNSHTIINWGMTQAPNWAKPGIKVLNDWKLIQNSCNKLTSLKTLSENGVRTPEFTSDIEVAKGWIKDGNTIFCRTKLRGHSGDGIVIAKKLEDIVPAQLFTKYVNGKHEFRVHVWNDGINEPIVFDATQKRKKEGWNNEHEDKQIGMIRSVHNGFVFCRENLVLPKDVISEAKKAIKALGLNFGGVDIRYREKDSKAYVLECNSSVGLEGTTLERYSGLFKSILNKQPIKSII